jgi:hypothetical protein
MSAFGTKRTSRHAQPMSALCQKQTKCTAAKFRLFDHLVGGGSSDCGMANPSCWQLKQLRSAEGAKHSFPPQSTDRVFIRSRSCLSNKTFLFLVVALTLHRAMMISILAIIDRVAEFDEAAPRKNAKACSCAPSQKQRVTNDAETE